MRKLCLHLIFGSALVLLAWAAYWRTQVQHQEQQRGLRDASDPADYSCEDLEAVPTADACEFVQTCDSESRIPYSQLYYCYVKPNGLYAELGFMAALLLVVLPLFFTLLCDAAEIYMSPTMALLSQSIPGLQPRVAGVTFVALGNGAPDLSSNINAIKSGNVLLSAGALTGASMFVQCIVASEVIRVAEGVETREAMLRDMFLYGISIVGVLVFFALGQITIVFVVWALGMYVLYVGSVCCGDDIICWVSHLFGGKTKSSGGFSWIRFRDGLLKWRDAYKGKPVMMYVDDEPAEGAWADEEEAKYGEYEPAAWQPVEGEDALESPSAPVMVAGGKPAKAGPPKFLRWLSGVKEEDTEELGSPGTPGSGKQLLMQAVEEGDEEQGEHAEEANGQGRQSSGGGGGGAGGSGRMSYPRQGSLFSRASDGTNVVVEEYAMFGDEPDLDLDLSATPKPGTGAVNGGQQHGVGSTRRGYPPPSGAAPSSRGNPPPRSFLASFLPFLFQQPAAGASVGSNTGGAGALAAEASASGVGGAAAAAASGAPAPVPVHPSRRLHMSIIARPGASGMSRASLVAPSVRMLRRQGSSRLSRASAGSHDADNLTTAGATAPGQAPKPAGPSHGISVEAGPAVPARRRRVPERSKLIAAKTYMLAVWADHVHEQVEVEAPTVTAGVLNPVRELTRARSELASLSRHRMLSEVTMADSSRRTGQLFASFVSGGSGFQKQPSGRRAAAGSFASTAGGKRLSGSGSSVVHSGSFLHFLRGHVSSPASTSCSPVAADARRRADGSHPDLLASQQSSVPPTPTLEPGIEGPGQGRPPALRPDAFAGPSAAIGSPTSMALPGGGLQRNESLGSHREGAVAEGEGAETGTAGAGWGASSASPEGHGLFGEGVAAAAASSSAATSRSRLGGAGRSELDGKGRKMLGDMQGSDSNSFIIRRYHNSIIEAARTPPESNSSFRLSHADSAHSALTISEAPEALASETGAAGEAGFGAGFPPAPISPMAGAVAAAATALSAQVGIRMARDPSLASRTSHEPLYGHVSQEIGPQMEGFGHPAYHEALPTRSPRRSGSSDGGGACMGDADGGGGVAVSLTQPLLSGEHAQMDEAFLEPELTTWQWCLSEVTAGNSEEWADQGPLQGWFRALVTPLLLVPYTLLRASIPLLDPSSYSSMWLLVSMGCAPLAIVAYCGYGEVMAVGAAAATGLVLSCLCLLITRHRDIYELPTLNLGTRFDFAPAVFSLLGFLVGVMWVDVIASEVVGILSLLASLLHIPSSVMGLTLMAWGNSLGDLAGNPALALNGLPAMALTACIASPLFNMLVSLATGFWNLLAQAAAAPSEADATQKGDVLIEGGVAHIALSADVALGCTFLIVYNTVMLAVGLRWGSVPRRFYLFARAWYCLYFVLACLLGFGVLDPLLPIWLRPG